MLLFTVREVLLMSDFGRSSMYIDGTKIIDIEGNENLGPGKCLSYKMQNGRRVLYIEGWSKSSLISLSATLQGPDTSNIAVSFSSLQIFSEATNQSAASIAISSTDQNLIIYITIAVVLGAAAAAGAAFVIVQLGQMTHVALVPGMPTVHMQMTLDMSLQDIPNMEQFKSLLVSDIAKCVNLYSWQVQILSIQPGSVVVNFVLCSPPNKKHIIEKAAESLQKQIQDPLSRLRKCKSTCRVISISSMPEQPPSSELVKSFKFSPHKEETQAATTRFLFTKSSLDTIKTGLEGSCHLLLLGISIQFVYLC